METSNTAFASDRNFMVRRETDPKTGRVTFTRMLRDADGRHLWAFWQSCDDPGIVDENLWHTAKDAPG